MLPLVLPSEPALKKYGLDRQAWFELVKVQGAACAICRKPPKTGRMVIDHEHVKGWKKMKPEQRRLYVRGLLCWFCNHYYVGRSITVEKARNVVTYLERYRGRTEVHKRLGDADRFKERGEAQGTANGPEDSQASSASDTKQGEEQAREGTAASAGSEASG